MNYGDQYGRRDMSAFSEDDLSTAIPTPFQPHLAHCCKCNGNEITAAAVRQRVGEDAAAGRQRMIEDNALARVRADNEMHARNSIINAAVHCTNELGDHAKAAQAFLERLFEIETKKLADPVMDRFKL